MSAPPFVLKRRGAAPVAAQALVPSFTSDEIVECIKKWNELYGAPPITSDWEPSRARHRGEEWRVERFESGHWPTLRVVRRRFGRFNAAIEAAGLTPNPAPGRIRSRLEGSDQILAAIREWLRRYGDVPTQADWDPVRARQLNQRWRITRYHEGDWPSMRSAAMHFGSFGGAIRAAGLVPRDGAETVDATSGRRAANRQALATGESRRAGAAGPQGLALGVRDIAKARDDEDPERLHAALLDLAAVALRWAGQLSAHD